MAKVYNEDLTVGGVKFDAGKIRMDLVPMDAVMAAAAVFTYGAIKYDDWNWAKGMPRGRLLAAMQRHAAAVQLGIELDDESGLPHTWHMLCCNMMLVAGDLREVTEDDIQDGQHAFEKAIGLFGNMKDPRASS